MKRTSDITAHLSQKEKSIVFSVSEAFFQAFVSGRMNNEIYVPLNDSWKRKLFEEGWRLKPEIRQYAIRIVNRSTKCSETRRCWSATVRMVPIRALERADRHIVLYLR